MRRIQLLMQLCVRNRRRSLFTGSVTRRKSHWGDNVHLSNGDIDDSDDDEDAIAERQEQQNFRQREVFLSRQIETLPATLIRGKCSVTLMSEVETSQSYLKREDAFFYSLVYDPQQKTLQADRGEIRIGSSYQAQVQPLLKDGETDERGPSESDGAGENNETFSS